MHLKPFPELIIARKQYKQAVKILQIAYHTLFPLTLFYLLTCGEFLKRCSYRQQLSDSDKITDTSIE